MASRRHAAFLLLLTTFVLFACASTQLAPIGSTPAFVPERDEEQIWAEARASENRLLPESYTYRDADLEKYLESIVQRLTPNSYRQAGGPPITVRVKREPRLNAYAFPHGLIIVTTGLVARADNEAQMASVLAHELTHIIERHAVRQQRHLENQQVAANVTAFLSMLALTAAAVDQSRRGRPEAAELLLRTAPPIVEKGLRLAFSATVSGYSRGLETDADEGGMRLMAVGGYDPKETASYLRTLYEEGPDRGAIETFFYGSHPRLADRLGTVERLVPALIVKQPLPLQQEVFDRRVALVRLYNAIYDAYLGRMALARWQGAKFVSSFRPSARPYAQGLVDGYIAGAALYGALSQQRNSDARVLFPEADAAYRRAITADAKSSFTLLAILAYKGLGLLHYNLRDAMGNPCEAKAAIGEYLILYPTAPDSRDMKAKLAELRCAY